MTDHPTPPEGARALTLQEVRREIEAVVPLYANEDGLKRAVLALLARVAPPAPTKLVTPRCEACDRPARYCGETHTYTPPTPPVEGGLDDLITKWRREAGTIPPIGTFSQHSVARSLHQCANELAATLENARPTPPVEGALDVVVSELKRLASDAGPFARDAQQAYAHALSLAAGLRRFRDAVLSARAFESRVDHVAPAVLEYRPMATDELPEDRDWTEHEWAMNQWWLANEQLAPVAGGEPPERPHDPNSPLLAISPAVALPDQIRLAAIQEAARSAGAALNQAWRERQGRT